MEIPQLTRRLSAIMSTDVVGYSRLMAADETGTLAALNRHREIAFDPHVSRYNGRIVKLMGDGTLVEFNSVVDALQCAKDIQQAASEEASGIVLRIGVNLGDVIIQGDDIFGDGVNIASRLEQLAKPGGICISSVVHESVGGRLEMVFQDGGEVSVKNIDRALRVFHWHPDVTSQKGKISLTETTPQTSDGAPSIAVLPFDNMSADPEQEFFSDGISEDIITDLSKVSGLLVIARNSSFAYKGKSVDLRTVGRELGVTSVLEGSVRRAGQRVRITAQLINAATGSHIWADRYDRDLTDIFAMQDEVTLEIVSALKIKLSPAERDNIAIVGTTNIEAHEDFMRMRGFLFLPGMNDESWKQAVAYGEHAIRNDPDYADAHALLAMMHLLDYHNHWSGTPSEKSKNKTEELVCRSLELRPDDLWPNHAYAVVARWQGKLDLAEKMMKKAMAMSPDYSLGLFTRGEIRLAQGRLSEAIEDIERAIRLDPAFRHQYLQFLAMAHLLKGNFETAALMLRERVFLVKDTDIGRAWLASALGHIGEIEEAGKIWAELVEINPGFSIRTRLERLTFADPSYAETVLQGLSKANLPEGK